MKSTYVDDLELGKGSLIYPDGHLHPNFNTTFTETGRLSCDEPNAQNYPSRNDKWVRRSIVAPKGHLMVAIDYGQLEACTGAMCSKDKYLVDALWNDYDIHMEWAVKIAQKMTSLVGGDSGLNDPKIMKKFRSLVKNKMVFPAFFGASYESVCAYLCSGTGQNVSQILVDDIMDEFWSTFDGMKKWQDKTMKRYYDIGYVETLRGRRHYYPLTRNQAVNMPIQGTAAELVCDAMNRLSMIAVETDKWYLHPVLNVHDDLTYFIPEEEPIFSDAIDTISREMLTFEGYPGVNVPFSIEISIGKNWADLKPLTKLWSHKDL
jgi:DNA polymerase-1